MKASYDFNDAKRGPIIGGSGKTRITINIDTDILDAFRAKAAAEGKGYHGKTGQARIKVCADGTAKIAT